MFTPRQDRRVEGAGGVYLATVTRVKGGVCYVEVPHLAPGFEYGPARYPADLHEGATAAAGDHTHDADADTTGQGGNHTHPAAGDHDHAAGTLATAPTAAPAETDPPHAHTIDGATATAGGHAHDAAGDHTHAIPAMRGAAKHTHGLRQLKAGDAVAVAFLEGGRDDLVVLVRLAPA